MLDFIKMIIRFFTGEPKYASHGDTKNKKFYPEWGIIIGHTNFSRGATGVKPSSIETNEYFYGTEMDRYILSKTAVADRNAGRGSYGAAVEIKEQICNCVIEHHLNSFNGNVGGFELLVLENDSESEHYARLIADAFSEKYPDRRMRHDNGIKFIKKGDRGYKNLKDIKRAGIEVAILSEAFFLDNPNEWISPEEMAEFWNEVLV